jgi:hypothetical protein
LNEYQAEVLGAYQSELDGLIKEIKVGEEGEHLWDNHQRVSAIALRLSEIHNEIANLEILGEDWPEIKKFRTLVVDPTIDRLDKIAAFESRKITAKQMEMNLERI